MFEIIIRLNSDCLIGSGKGYGAVIDSDVILDDLGIPYIPGKRIKGLLRNSACDVISMFNLSHISLLDSPNNLKMCDLIDELFGKPGDSISSIIRVDNFFIKDYYDNYDKIQKELQYFKNKFPALLNHQNITQNFCNIKNQTKINIDGVAADKSLRTNRTVKSGILFKGKIDFECENALQETYHKLIYYASLNLRNMGTNRTRGYGNIELEILDEKNLILEFKNELEQLCDT